MSERLYDLETRLLKPDVRRSPDKVKELLAEDFLEFGQAGTVWNRDDMIAEMSGETAMQVEIDSFNERPIAPDVVLVTYRATVSEGGVVSRSLRSSLWRKTGDRWQMVFHQGTPTAM